MRKCVFFDADGTLLDLKAGVPADVTDALQRLTANGHLAFLCTGRARCLVPPEVAALPFDGMICGLGVYVEIGGQPVYRVAADPAEARRAVEVVRAGGMIPLMEGDALMYYDESEYNEQVEWFAPYMTRLLGEHYRPLTGHEDTLCINKISAKTMPGCRPDWVCEQLADTFDAVRHEAEGISGRTLELMLKGHSKGGGIRWVCDRLGIDMADTIAFGDSNNDLDMLQTVHTGVAMGNATAGLLAAADYVTAPLLEGGIPKALTHLGLI